MMSSVTHYVAAQQIARHQASQVDQLIGRRPLPTPSDLTRILYIPHHNENTLHLPLYDVANAYADIVGDTPIGSSLYTVKLTTMRKPRGDGTDAQVAYLVNFEKSPDGAREVRVQRRVPGGSLQDPDVQV